MDLMRAWRRILDERENASQSRQDAPQSLQAPPNEEIIDAPPAEPRAVEREGAWVDLADASKALTNAHAMINMLNNRERKWTMSIPARPDIDPDLVISEALLQGDLLVAEVARLRAAASSGERFRQVRGAIRRVVESGYRLEVTSNGRFGVVTASARKGRAVALDVVTDDPVAAVLELAEKVRRDV